MAHTEITFLRCAECQCQIWNDIPNIKNISRTRFQCMRCGKMIRLSGCSACGERENWTLVKGIEKKAGWRPYYRFQCNSCGRELGIRLDVTELSRL